MGKHAFHTFLLLSLMNGAIISSLIVNILINVTEVEKVIIFICLTAMSLFLQAYTMSVAIEEDLQELNRKTKKKLHKAA